MTDNPMREADIRPQHLLRTYLDLSAQDAELLFEGVPRKAIPCVGCGAANVTAAFEKNTFGFARCTACGSLYQTPRPSAAAFEAFYKDSKSSEFWAKEFFPTVAEARRKTVFEPRAKALAQMVAGTGCLPETIIDVGAGHGVFLKALVDCFEGSSGIAVEPSAEMAASCRAEGFEVYQALAEDVTDLREAADLTCALEVMEHVYDPLTFLKCLVDFTRPGGSVFFTTLGSDGFDIQVLGEHANAVSPPHHLNFMSVQGFTDLCRRAGLSDVSVTTPGKLDTDIVRNRFADIPKLEQQNPFFAALLSDPRKASAFQKFLAENQLSSHTWVFAKKPERTV